MIKNGLYLTEQKGTFCKSIYCMNKCRLSQSAFQECPQNTKKNCGFYPVSKVSVSFLNASESSRAKHCTTAKESSICGTSSTGTLSFVLLCTPFCISFLSFAFIQENFFVDPTHVEQVFEQWPNAYSRNPDAAILQLINFLIHVSKTILLINLSLTTLF